MQGFGKVLIACVLSSLSACRAAGDAVDVAVDIGHSLVYPGAVSARGKPEFAFNAELADALRQALVARRINGLLIGAEGLMLDLRRRTEIAKANSAGLFLSIHHDSVQPQYLQHWQWQGQELAYSDQFSGFSLFVSRKNRYLEKSLDCARLLGEALRQKGFVSSNHHAEPIAGENRPWADAALGIYYFDDLVVLKTADMPAILLEAGIIVNRDQELVLQNGEARNLMAIAVAEGIEKCLRL